MAMRKGELALEQVQAYYRSHHKSVEAHVKAVGKLTDRLALTKDPEEIEEYRGRILDVEEDRALLNAARLAFNAGRDAIEPPTREQLVRLGLLTRSVEALDAEQRIAARVLHLMAETIATFREIHPPQG